MPSVLLMNSSSPNRYSNPATGLCTLSMESLTPTIPVGTTMHTECLADELINTASLRRGLYTPNVQSLRLTVIQDRQYMPSVLLINSSSPNRYSNPATGLCTPNTPANIVRRSGLFLHAKCLADELIQCRIAIVIQRGPDVHRIHGPSN